MIIQFGVVLVHVSAFIGNILFFLTNIWTNIKVYEFQQTITEKHS